MTLTSEDTKKFHLQGMLLLEAPQKRNAVEIIQKLGYVQLDTIFVTARSHDLVLHSRSTSYKEEDIWKDHKKSRVFEEFAHARSLLDISELPFYYRRMLIDREKPRKWFEAYENIDEIIKSILDYIKKEGEITTSQVPKIQKTDSRWSSPNKLVLDYLTDCGYIHVSRREGFSKVYYKMIEDVFDLPDIDNLPDRMEVFWHDIDKTLSNQGLVPRHRLLQYTYSQRRFEYQGKKQSPQKLIKDAIKEGKIQEHEIGGTETRYYSHPNYTENHEIPLVEEKQVFLLSPFDNALWSRESLLDQYNFSYKFEAYTPEKDRIYGFFTLPILFGTDFVGRVDPKYDRKTSTLHLRIWSWEKGFKPSTLFWDKLSLVVDRLLQFHGGSGIEWGNLSAKYRKELTSRI